MTNFESVAARVDAVYKDEQEVRRTMSNDAGTKLCLDVMAGLDDKDRKAFMAGLRAKEHGAKSLVIEDPSGTVTVDLPQLYHDQETFLAAHDRKLGAAAPALARTIESGSFGSGHNHERMVDDFRLAAAISPDFGAVALAGLIDHKLEADHSQYRVWAKGGETNSVGLYRTADHAEIIFNHLTKPEN